MDLKPLVFSVLESNLSSINGVHTPKRNGPETNIDSLSISVLEEIFSRIPVKTLLCCRTVCKLWLSVIGDSVFKTHHYSRANACPLLIYHNFSSETNRLYPVTVQLVEGECLSDHVPQAGNHKLISRIGLSFPEFGPVTRAIPRRRLSFKSISCEGVVCSCLRGSRDGRDLVQISNPITGEYLTIDLFDGATGADRQRFASVFIGLGFSRVDKKFKFLRRVSEKRVRGGDDNQNRRVRVTQLLQYWIVGSKGWQPVQDSLTPTTYFNRKVDDVVYANGVIYWSYLTDRTIYSFDFDVDEFQVEQLPKMSVVSGELNRWISSMGVLRGSLCVSVASPDDACIELWMIEKNRGSKTGWRQIFTIETVMGNIRPPGCYRPIKYLECGKVLLHDWHETFLIYDPVTKIHRTFRAYLEGCGAGSNLQVISHVPSLIPLSDSLNIVDANIQKSYRNNQKPHRLYTFI